MHAASILSTDRRCQTWRAATGLGTAAKAVMHGEPGPLNRPRFWFN